MSFNILLPNFDTLVSLHEDDPEAFEAFRKHLFKEAIQNSPARHRPMLEQLLKKIDDNRDLSEPPLEAATKAFRLMMDSVGRLRSTFAQAQEELAGLQTTLLIQRCKM